MKNIKDEKAVFREKHKAQRAALTADEKKERDNKIAEYLFSTMAYKDAGRVLLYYALPLEIGTLGIFENAVADGKQCFFPRCLDYGKMYFHLTEHLTDLKRGKFNIPEPLESAPLYTPQERDVCIVPAISYDRQGYRMGYGKGYYDRFLSTFPGTKIGICYSENIEPRLPRGRYDVNVDILLTEQGLYRLKR